MSLSPLNRDSHFEHRAEASRQQRIAQQNLEQERARHERELLHQRADLRRAQQTLHEREDAIAEREGRLAERERETNVEAAEEMARSLHVDVVDRAPISGDRAALVAAIFRARDKALGLIPPDPPTHPTARAAIELYNRLTGLTDDASSSPTGLAAQAIEVGRRLGLSK